MNAVITIPAVPAEMSGTPPQLKHWAVYPQKIVEPEHDPNAWQQTRMRTVASGENLFDRPLNSGDKIILDFGEPVVGTFHFVFDTVTQYADSPVRIKLVAGELPYEVTAPLDTYRGTLSRAWIQDEVVNIDNLPGKCVLPRRYSCRYLAIELIAVPGQLLIKDLFILAEGAESDLPPSPIELEPEMAAIDRVGIRTLRNCMQTCFEDGPKRDRRLWCGDLRLQAMVNAVSYRRFDLVERSLYLLAGCADEDGRIPGCVFERPEPIRGCQTLSYALLFAVVLEEHCRWSGRLDIGRDLFPIASHQFDLVRPYCHADGVFHDLNALTPFWIFVDHQAELDVHAAFQGIYIFALKALSRLARQLHQPMVADRLNQEAEKMVAGARNAFYDNRSGLVYSGPNRQLSCASQIWMILCGALTPTEGRRALDALDKTPGALMPVSPYMYHYYLEACEVCGDRLRLEQTIRNYWGKMVEHGADTFWEVFVPGDDFFSPYGDPRLNSACHAWSCTPSYFLRSAKTGEKSLKRKLEIMNPGPEYISA